MGMDVSAKMIYGLHYDDVPEYIIEQVDEDLDNGILDYVSPGYDSPKDEWIIGVEVDVWNSSTTEVADSMAQAISNIPSYLIEHEEGNLYFYVSQHVY